MSQLIRTRTGRAGPRGVLLLALVLGLSALLAACSSSGGSGEAAQAATRTALAQSLGSQTTAVDATQTTPAAPDADAPAAATPDDALAGANATATAQAVEREVTRVAVAAATSVAQAATAEAAAPMMQEVQSYGVDPSQGSLAWVHPPITIQAEGYMEYDYANRFLATVAEDFVLAADITWNTQFGTTGCGFVVRSDGNEEAINQYLIIATRGAQGHVLFGVQEAGKVDLDETVDIYANGIDPRFGWQNDQTNRIAVVARGQTFTLFSNGTRLGDIQGPLDYDKGFVAFVALNESGTTTCTFENAFLWLLN
jgi:hypothetical protein